MISEIMFNPGTAEDDNEWIELANIGGTALDLTGYVVDDGNTSAHAASNIASGSVPAGGSAVLYNADDLTAAQFTAAWGPSINLVPVINWAGMGLNNGGDTIGLWTDFTSYSGDNQTQANALLSITYAGTLDDGMGSIF